MNEKIKHPRCAIRKAFVAKLKTSSTIAGENVFDSRVKPLFEQHLPAILVYSRDERVVENQFSDDGSTPLKRDLEIYVECVLKSSDELDDELDEIALDVEKSLSGFEIQGFNNATITLKATECDVVADATHVFGAVRLTYSVIYYTKEIQ